MRRAKLVGNDLIDDGHTGGDCHDLADGRFFTVLCISSGEVLYQGRSILETAIASEPGTLYCEGATQDCAAKMARNYRQRLLAKIAAEE